MNRKYSKQQKEIEHKTMSKKRKFKLKKFKIKKKVLEDNAFSIALSERQSANLNFSICSVCEIFKDT